MNRRSLLAVALLPLFALPASAARPVADPVRSIDAARVELAATMDLIPQIRNPNVQREMMRKMQEVDRLLAEAQAAHVVPRGPEPMSQNELAALDRALQAEAFEDERVDLLRSAAAQSWFTTAQALEVMEHFRFSDGQVDAADILWDRIVDPQNAWQLYGALTFSSDKEELRRRVEG